MLSTWISAATLAASISYTSAQSIDPSSVPLTTRQTWCQSQETECPLICLQLPGVTSAGTDSNTCDPSSLGFSCVCANGQQPNSSEYSLTMPYFICTQFNLNCVTNCGSDNTCAAACNQDNPCGAQDPTRVNTSTVSTMSATATKGSAVATSHGTAAASTGVAYTGFGGSGAAATTAASSGDGSSAASRLIINFGELYGLVAVAGGIFAGFTFML